MILGGVVVVGLAAAFAVLGLFGLRQESDSPGTVAASAQYERILPGLCEARRRARAGKLNQAGIVYQDEAHVGVHLLFASVTEKNRSVAARLGESHVRVERDITQFDPLLAQHLTGLIDATRAALISLSLAAVDCPVASP